MRNAPFADDHGPGSGALKDAHILLHEAPVALPRMGTGLFDRVKLVGEDIMRRPLPAKAPVIARAIRVTEDPPEQGALAAEDYVPTVNVGLREDLGRGRDSVVILRPLWRPAVRPDPILEGKFRVEIAHAGEHILQQLRLLGFEAQQLISQDRKKRAAGRVFAQHRLILSRDGHGIEAIPFGGRGA